MNDRELNTVLAALRFWQRNLETLRDGTVIPPLEWDFDQPGTPLDAGEIDALCERLNTDPAEVEA